MDFSRRNFIKMAVGSTALAASSSKAIADAADAVEIPKRKFGRHDDMLTVVGFGSHTLYFAGSQKEASQIMHRAIDRGVNFFDNAWGYHGGKAEEYMGNALVGHRDKVFLASKFSNFRDDKYSEDLAGAMKSLEDSLRRLKTDHLDLWMMHNVIDNDADDAYKDDGAIAAIELAKKQGKIRYGGFTGHTTPSVHVDMINGGYEWDATLMPVSVVGALSSRSFETDVMPLCEKHNIAVFGMKGFGGSRRTQLHGQTNVEEVLRYSLSYNQVCSHLVGVDKLEYVDLAIAGSAGTPMTEQERSAFVVNDTPLSPHYADYHHGGHFYNAGIGGEKNHEHTA